MYSDKSWNTKSFNISTANHVTRRFRCHKQYVVIFRRNDLTEMNVKSVCEQESCTFFEVRSNFTIVHRSLCFVWHKNLNYIRTASCFSNRQYFKAVFFGFIKRLTFTKTHYHIKSAFTQVLCMSMPLASVSNNCDSFSFQ
ncbi:hypothetical protein D3C81_1712420 [compost metagenome]